MYIILCFHILDVLLNRLKYVNRWRQYGCPCTWQYVIIGSDDGLLLNRRPAIARINEEPARWHIHASPGLNALTHWGRVTYICVS